jgi:hypothetical protein
MPALALHRSRVCARQRVEPSRGVRLQSSKLQPSQPNILPQIRKVFKVHRSGLASVHGQASTPLMTSRQVARQSLAVLQSTELGYIDAEAANRLSAAKFFLLIPICTQTKSSAGSVCRVIHRQAAGPCSGCRRAELCCALWTQILMVTEVLCE